MAGTTDISERPFFFAGHYVCDMEIHLPQLQLRCRNFTTPHAETHPHPFQRAEDTNAAAPLAFTSHRSRSRKCKRAGSVRTMRRNPRSSSTHHKVGTTDGEEKAKQTGTTRGIRRLRQDRYSGKTTARTLPAWPKSAERNAQRRLRLGGSGAIGKRNWPE